MTRWQLERHVERTEPRRSPDPTPWMFLVASGVTVLLTAVATLAVWLVTGRG